MISLALKGEEYEEFNSLLKDNKDSIIQNNQSIKDKILAELSKNK